MIEGRLVLGVLVSGRSRLAVESVLVSDAAARALGEELGAAERLGGTIYVCAQEVMNTIAGFDIHRGCLAVAGRGMMWSVPQLVGSVDPRGPSVVVVLEEVNNHDNVGAIARAVAAFGGSGVFMSEGTADPLYRKAIRVSMGAALTVSWARARWAWPGELRRLRGAGYELVGLVTDDAAERIGVYAGGLGERGTRRVALVVGSEGDGLGEKTRALMDRTARVPMGGGVDSLSASMACGIALSRVSEALGLV